ETTGGIYRLGQQVRVRLAEATPLTGSLRFEMLSDTLTGERKNHSRPKGKRTSRPKAKK
ncbi:MAG: hypothetical protein JKX88_03670, partial [Marinicaulis sp.]|nr:hypothetical protein [Marinicaulis sp.]